MEYRWMPTIFVCERECISLYSAEHHKEDEDDEFSSLSFFSFVVLSGAVFTRMSVV